MGFLIGIISALIKSLLIMVGLSYLSPFIKRAAKTVKLKLQMMFKD